MSHLSSFHAIQFRGISGLRLDTLAQVNLITGSNGIGKTSVAEAIWLFNGRFTPGLPWNANVQRSLRDVVDPIARLARGDAVELGGTELGASHRWKATFEPIPVAGGSGTEISPDRSTSRDTPPGADAPSLPIPARGRLRVWLDDTETDGQNGILTQAPGGGLFLTPVINRPADHAPAIIHLPASSMDLDKETISRFSELVAQGRKDSVKQTLRLVLPRLSDVEVITDHSGQPFILATTTENERLPLQALGGGMTRLFRLFVGFHGFMGGLVVVDEIENGLHYLVLPEFWRRVQAMAEEFDVQMFATTHSRECIDSALEAFADHPDRLAVHALFRHDDDTVHANTYAGETLQAARELDLDLR